MGVGQKVSGRRRHARRVARLLAPAAAGIGGFASAEARVRARPGLILRPDVCVDRGDPPYDGLLARAPLLVVVLGPPTEACAWLALGAGAVWSLTDRCARVHLPGGSVSRVPPGGRLVVPACPGVTVGVHELLGAAGPPGDPVPGDPVPPSGAAPALRPPRVLR